MTTAETPGVHTPGSPGPSHTPGSPEGKAVVLYDGECPLCQRAIRSVKRLDWLKRLHFQNCRDTAKWPPSAVPLDLGHMLEEMHLVTPDRKRVYVGFRAFRWMAWRMPMTLPFAPFLYLPGVPWLGNKVYLWIAKRRYNLVPCKDGVCALPLRGKHSGFGIRDSGKSQPAETEQQTTRPANFSEPTA